MSTIYEGSRPGQWYFEVPSSLRKRTEMLEIDPDGVPPEVAWIRGCDRLNHLQQSRIHSAAVMGDAGKRHSPTTTIDGVLYDTFLVMRACLEEALADEDTTTNMVDEGGERINLMEWADSKMTDPRDVGDLALYLAQTFNFLPKPGQSAEGNGSGHKDVPKESKPTRTAKRSQPATTES